MDQRCPKICYQKKEDGLTVTACYGIDGQIYLPDELRGEPITAIAPYAFSDREPEEGDICWMEEGAEALSGLHRLNIEYSNAIVHAFQKFRAPFSGKIVHIFPEQSAVI